MKIEIHNRCSDHESYRSERVKSLFNVESGANFDLESELPIDDKDWSIGVVVGPSGSGKSSIGKALWKGKALYKPEWEKRVPIIDSITPNGDFNAVTSALASVGLGSVPTWLRPYEVLSNGEQFRADLAKVICDRPEQVVIDEFSSVVDRQIATIGAGAFQKAYRRTSGQAVLLTCHYDVLEWLEPDWVYDTATGEFLRGGLWRRPKIEMQIHQTNWQFWPTFEPHHYLKLPHMIAATNYVATVNGELVAHVAFSTRPGLVEARACRLVVMPEWQGAGVGLKFLNAICEMWRQGNNRYDKPMPTLFHTSHPGLCTVLRRHPKWTQVSANLYGGSKRKSRLSIAASTKKKTGKQINSAGFGGHFRAVQGFRYIGDGGVQ